MKKIEIAQAELALNLSNKPRILPLAQMDSNKKANNYTFKGFKIWMKKNTHDYYKGIKYILNWYNYFDINFERLALFSLFW